MENGEGEARRGREEEGRDDSCFLRVRGNARTSFDKTSQASDQAIKRASDFDM